MGKIIVIGAGFSSLAAACYLAKAGLEVEIIEKNGFIGGRARQLHRAGFVFDAGPTFYWMPDVFEKFFADFGRTPSDYYELVRLDPGYQVYFEPGRSVPVPADIRRTEEIFDSIEPGSGRALKKFMDQAGFNYRVAMDRIVYKPGRSPWELVTPQTAMRLPQFLTSLHHKVRRTVRDPRLESVMEFPALFLGAKPSETPAFYCFMDYAGMVGGTWHVLGGMGRLAAGLARLAESMGVKVRLGTPVEGFVTDRGDVKGVIAGGEVIPADGVISGADYRHTETLLEKSSRNYSEKYWQSRTMAPSALLFYVAFGRKLRRVAHHTLFFDADFAAHAADIYDSPAWPADPLFYASFPSLTDATMAPPGKEAAVFLIPVAAGLRDTPQLRRRYFNAIIERTERITGQTLRSDILFVQSYAPGDFQRDYNSYKGNAYGLANTLFQTAFLKPKIYNRHLRNLFYTGQLTVPGPGVPPAIISGKIAAGELLRELG